jgi:hypothetical protein
MNSPEKTFQTAKEEQTTRILRDVIAEEQPSVPDALDSEEMDEGLDQHDLSVGGTSSPISMSPERKQATTVTDVSTERPRAPSDDIPSEDIRSPSEGSSPIRPVVRKSSLNFASLPAREPLVGGKSIGNRVSRTSHLDHHRASYYSRPGEGKNVNLTGKFEDSNEDDSEPAEATVYENRKISEDNEDVALHHTKTYTQRLQDQISMLGKSQQTNARQSKSIPSSIVAQSLAPTTTQATAVAETSSPSRREPTTTTPGAFPMDEDDDWIEPPATLSDIKETRPPLPKSHSADIMEKIHGKSTVGVEMMATDDRETQSQEPSDANYPSPSRLAAALGHRKSASSSAAPAVARSNMDMGLPLTKAVTVSNPTRAAAAELPQSETYPESPSRNFRDSPLKQVKNKLSSILKSSKGLLASSAAISAQGKSSILSPSPGRIGFFPGPSLESVVTKFSMDSPRSRPVTQSTEQPSSPTRPVNRRTRASTEREKEEKRREKEAKLIAEQFEKLEKAREKEREKARVFSKGQEKTAQTEAQVVSKSEQEVPAVKETPKPTRTSPRKVKGAGEGNADKEVEMPDASSMMPPPSVPRSTGLGQTSRSKEVKRPVKPTKDAYTKPKQAPTVIRVNTGSQHSQMNPATGNAAPNSGSAASQPQQQLSSKASKASLQQKPVSQSLKSSVSSTGRPRALEAAKKKEQDEREAQRRRDAKAEMERKRAAAQEELRKQEQQRKQEAEAQKQKEMEQAEAKKLAQRQAAIEKAKQTRAPPPAVRSQLNGSFDTGTAQERPQSVLSNPKSETQPARPHSRMASGISRPYDDSSRPVNAVLSNAAKSAAKRPFGADAEDGLSKRPPSRGGPSYQNTEAKRRRTSAEFDDTVETSYAPNIKGPPVRPSGGFKKVSRWQGAFQVYAMRIHKANNDQDLPTKSMFQSGYSTVPKSANGDLFKATVTAQAGNFAKAAHPLDMAQISKGAIPFAPNPNAAGPSYKTPARPGAFSSVKSAAKSVQRSSPRFQNGESIELPEIQTDDEDEDDEESHGMGVASWADSPDLRRALMQQEYMDPSAVFGHPAPLNMEEVFNKSKDRFHKFRMRTSSANWSGTDRLTEDDIRKDMAARDKMRREGGWSYEMSKDML